MSPRETTSVLRNLDAARSIFDVLSHMLENNAESMVVMLQYANDTHPGFLQVFMFVRGKAQCERVLKIELDQMNLKNNPDRYR